VSEPRVRLYGHARGEASFSQVTRGMERALRAADEFAGFCSLEATDEVDAAVDTGFGAPISLNCGNPMGLVRAHQMGLHRSHWLLLAPNGETLPHGFAEALTETSAVLPRGMLTGGLLAPSGWAAAVLRRLFPSFPIVIAPHGVSPEIHQPDQAARNAVRIAYGLGQFNVLHMTSSETERKSTKLLLSAWRQAKRSGWLPAQAKLFVTMNPVHMNKLRWWCSEFDLTDQDVLITPGLAYGQEGVAAMYRSMHAICQPSRGEGFGMVGLESLACGVPIIATSCTGHSEWLLPGLPGAVVVPHGADAPVDDFPGSLAPTVTASAIADALGRSYANWQSLADAAETNASALGAEWSWEAKNVPAIRRMIKETEEHA
jgi:glycosyltransferase involved in cell wall biosynthesis